MGSSPKQIILRNFYSPGDILMLTAAVRDLHKCYPGRFLTDVRSSSPELWENNPYVTPLDDDDPKVELIDCKVALINKCNQTPYHYVHAFIEFLNDRLGIRIKPTAFKGDIHISDLEKSWFSQVHELTGREVPFWIVVAGGKFDVTIKWWDVRRYQRVIDHFRGKVQFVQVGGEGHFHPKLDGVIDLRGKTDLRELVRLVYHSQGVLCGVTCLMHLAAAVEVRGGNPPHRPCVVVAGGREPMHWEAYPHHQFIHTIGALPCCKEGGCWRDRTFPLGDDNKRDKPENLCVDVVDGLPRCMDMITSDEVIRRIEMYVDGGVLKCLTQQHAEVVANAVAAADANPFDDTPLTVRSARTALEMRLRNLPRHPGKFRGRGIVICGGGVRSFTGAWVCINMLRRFGCKLPIQLWHLGVEELDEAMESVVAPLQVQCIDATEIRKRHASRILSRQELKPYAILHCQFKEVLLLDADNVPVVNPEFSFETPEFRKTGAIFWPHYERPEPTRQVWDLCGVPFQKKPLFAGGQIVVDKERCWRALELCMWFNENSDFFCKDVLGDGETFRLAFRKLNQPFAMPDMPVDRLEGVLCQHDFKGRRMFQSRTTDKWNLFLTNKRIKGFRHEAECRSYLTQLRQIWDGGMTRFKSRLAVKAARPERVEDVNGREPKIEAWMISCHERSEIRQRTLKRLKATDWGLRPISVQIDCSRHKNRVLRITHTHRQALLNSLRSGTDYVLVLEDDLEFNRFFWHNLVNWSPLSSRVLAFGSLYNPDISPLACDVENHFFIADPSSVYGSQALLLSIKTVRHVLRHWGRIAAPLDIRIPRLVAELNLPIFYHAPSLVQHCRVKSTWGGRAHQAADFDPLWKASNHTSPGYNAERPLAPGPADE